ncbi:glycosyltransferase family 39 protein [Methanolobus sp. WCC4]|uniref:glycosyltransferase family 39 protein n=1 Tax=Methanolobus sp. WCC4 TaxID=3125784 RepID=UPI0030F52239
MMNSHKTYLLIALVIGTSMRFYGLDIQSLWVDELYTITNASFSLAYLFDTLSYDVHPPLHNLFLFLWMKLFGDSEVSVRLPSAMAGFLSMIAMYHYTKQFYGKNIATSATILLSLTFAGIYYSQEARSYSFLLLFSIVSTFLFMKIVTTPEENKVNYYHYAFYSVIAILISYTHYFGLLLIILQCIYWITISYVYGENKYKPILVALILIISYLPWFQILKTTISEKNGGNFWIPTPTLHLFIDFFMTATYPKKTIVLIFFLLIVIIPLIINFKQFRSNLFSTINTISLKSPTFIAVYLILSSSSITFLISQHTPILTVRNLLIIAPMVYLLIALWVSMNPLFGNHKQNAYILATCLICLMMLLPSYYSPNKEQFREAIEYSVNQADIGTYLLFLGDYDMHNRYNYYVNKQNIPTDVTLVMQNPNMDLIEYYNASLTNVNDLIIIGAHTRDLNENEKIYLEEQYDKCTIKKFYSAIVYEYKNEYSSKDNQI